MDEFKEDIVSYMKDNILKTASQFQPPCEVQQQSTSQDNTLQSFSEELCKIIKCATVPVSNFKTVCETYSFI